MARQSTAEIKTPEWTFLSNHAHVLVCIAKNPDIRLSQVALAVGIQERTVHRIVHELSDAGYLKVRKSGRTNTYQVNLEKPLRHPLESDHSIKAIVKPLLNQGRKS